MTADPQVVPPRSSTGPGAGKIVLAVIGALLALVGLGLLAGGATVAWANGTQRDDGGFFTARHRRSPARASR